MQKISNQVPPSMLCQTFSTHLNHCVTLNLLDTHPRIQGRSQLLNICICSGKSETLSRWKRGDVVIESRPHAAWVLADVMHWSRFRLKGRVFVFTVSGGLWACRECLWLHYKTHFTHFHPMLVLENSLGMSPLSLPAQAMTLGTSF